MAGYQPERGRRGGERPGRPGGAPHRAGSPGIRRDGAPASRRDPGYAGPGYRDGGRRDAGYGDAGYGDAGYRDAGYRDAGYRETGYRETGYGAETGYRGGRAGSGYQDGYGPGQYRDRAATATDRRAGPGDPDGPGRGHARRRDTTGGAEGNERLTALTGALLLGLLAAEGFTILAIHQMLTLHFFIGMLLVGPVLLKAGSTVYRFARYYTGAPGYRRKGPPAPLLRLLGPLVLGLSVAVIGSGIMLAVTGPSGQLWIFLHKASFVLWFGAMSIHVLAYVWRLPHLVTSDLATRTGARARDVLAGRQVRWLLLAASLLLGLLLALLTYHQAAAWAGYAGGG